MHKREFQRGWLWYTHHRDHVDKMLKGKADIPEIEPTGSDAFRPELWKDIHWAWFFAKYV